MKQSSPMPVRISFLNVGLAVINRGFTAASMAFAVALLIAFLGAFFADPGLARAHPLSKIYSDSPTALKDLQNKFGEGVMISLRFLTQPDGFETAYWVLESKKQLPTKVAAPLHGFDTDGLYWVDFVKSSQLLESGYKVVLVDLATRGQTAQRNFPFIASTNFLELPSYRPNQTQQAWLREITPAKQASYVANVLREEGAERLSAPARSKLAGVVPFTGLPVMILGHSYGAAVAANLIYQLGRENKESENVGKKNPWIVDSYWSFNGFVSYPTNDLRSLESLGTVLSKGRESAQSSIGNLNWEHRSRAAYEAFERVLDLSSDLAKLRNVNIVGGGRITEEAQRENQQLFDLYQRVQQELQPIIASYSPAIEGAAENFFVDAVLHGFDARLQEAGRPMSWSERDQRRLREAALMSATMQGLRINIQVSRQPNGAHSLISENSIIPDSVLGIYYRLAKGSFPGLPARLNIVASAKDPVVPLKLSELTSTDQVLNAANSGEKPANTANDAAKGVAIKLVVIAGDSHFLPDTLPIQEMLAKSIGANSLRTSKLSIGGRGTCSQVLSVSATGF